MGVCSGPESRPLTIGESSLPRLLLTLRGVAACVLIQWSLAGFAQSIGFVTVLQGDMRIVREDDSLQAAAGMPLAPGDLIATSDGAFAVLEFQDGTVLGLGGASRAFLFRLGGGKNASNGSSVYLLEGWMKAQLQDAPYAFTASETQIAAAKSSLVVNAASGRNAVFVEGGQVDVSQLVGRALKGKVLVGRGQFAVQKPGKPPAMEARPDPEFLAGLPRPFRDPLPSLFHRYADKPGRPAGSRPVEYAEVAPWMRLGPPWSGGMTQRFQDRLRDPAFRSAVSPEVSRYREWDRILNPQKYREPDGLPGSTGSSSKNNYPGSRSQ